MDLNRLLEQAVQAGASDIHLKLGRAPLVRRDGVVEALEGWEPLHDQNLLVALERVCADSPAKLNSFHESGDLDLAYAAPNLPRFRVNAFRQRGAISFAFRVIPTRVPTFEDLGLPPGVRRLAEEHRGLVLVTGATGSGKTTTLAAVVNHINHTRKQHIVTIEDPIEVLHDDAECIVNQREIGLDTADFAQALRRALRQDPDTILIGELRDSETAQTALQAAESGHLVLSTMHTVDAAETVSRLIEFFPPVKQQQIRSITAGVLRGVVSQRLLPALGGGRVVAAEVMVNNARIAELIREDRADEIHDAIAEGEFFEMQSYTRALLDHVLAGRVDKDVAADAATNRHDFLVELDQELRAAGVPTEPAAEDATEGSDPAVAEVEESPALGGLRIAGS
jgi:twitching motility protein PilT